MPASDTHWLYKWPRDIEVPDLVLLLVVSEAQRCIRMQSRVNTGDISMTVEETQLARDALKRARWRLTLTYILDGLIVRCYDLVII